MPQINKQVFFIIIILCGLLMVNKHVFDREKTVARITSSKQKKKQYWDHHHDSKSINVTTTTYTQRWISCFHSWDLASTTPGCLFMATSLSGFSSTYFFLIFAINIDYHVVWISWWFSLIVFSHHLSPFFKLHKDRPPYHAQLNLHSNWYSSSDDHP